MTIQTITRAFVVAIGVLGFASTSLEAQQDDGRWLPFIGCWEAIGAEDEIGLLCFESANGGVILTNFVSGEVVSTEQLVADGQQRSVSAEGCEGWETVEFSRDGRRAFTQTEFLCGSDVARAGTGVMTFTAPNRWEDVRVLDVDGEGFAWVQAYMLASVDRLAEEGVDDPAAGLGMTVRSARMVAAAPITLANVEEASARMDAKAVETWIVAQGDAFDPSADDLIRLADSGVDESVIDAVVAVSHPEKFIVEAGGSIEEFEDYPVATHYRGYMAFSPWMGPAWGLSRGYGYAPGYYGYSPGYGYGYGSMYGYGYGYRSYGYGYLGNRPGYVIIDRRPSGGRVYNGRGYSRGGASGRVRGTARPRGGSATPSYSTGGRSGGAAASGESRRAPRQARRRPGGGSEASMSAMSSMPVGSVSGGRRAAPSRPSGRVSRSASTPPSGGAVRRGSSRSSSSAVRRGSPQSSGRVARSAPSRSSGAVISAPSTRSAPSARSAPSRSVSGSARSASRGPSAPARRPGGG